MSELTLVKTPFTMDSREVAEMIGKRHSDLLESIENYTSHLLNGNFRSEDFFIKSSYQDSTGRTLPCYNITRKGCDMVANKLTGEKGTLFTAAYVTKFEEMERQQSFDASNLSPTLQMFNQLFLNAANLEIQQQQLKHEISEVKNTLYLVKNTVANHPEDNWRDTINSMLNKIVAAVGGKKFQEIRSDSYKLLEERAGVNLNIRLSNFRERLIEAGSTKTKISNANKLDIIESDKKLREIYTGIIKELTIKHVA